MKQIALLFVALIPASICCAAAFYMALHDKTGWGWFLFVGLVTAGIEMKQSK